MTIQLLAGDCRDVLPTLAADSVHTCVTSPPYYALRSYLDATHPDKHHEIGSESSPDEYLATMVAVFREVRRVLRPDGTCWVNMGDSYASTKVGNTNGTGPTSLGMKNEGSIRSARRYGAEVSAANEARRSFVPDGLKPKDLLLMPARLALALQADGWWVRSDIIWHKPNPMPESCTDRPTSAHEHVFLLTRSARYYYDADAVREEATAYDHASRYAANPSHGATAIPGRGDNGARMTCGIAQPTTSRNLRNVWTIATSPYPNAHFATFPPELAERCIRAGTSERGCCAACGKPWGRVTERPPIPDEAFNKARVSDDPSVKASPLHRSGKASGQKMQKWLDENPWQTTGWQPGCDHGAEVVPCRVLDPFAGAGTTLLVADRLQRDAIGIELNAAYTEMAMERCRADAPLFTSFPPAEPPEDERIADLFADAAE